MKNKMIQKPTLIIDKEKCLRNIKRMSEKAKKSNVKFRPHFKTHNSAEVGKWFKKFNINSITVSSVEMALYFAENGWNDITIAFPLNILEIDKINNLAEKITLNLLVENIEGILFLAKNLKYQAGVFIKIDTGYHRTGLEIDDILEIDEIIKICDTYKNIKLKGFLTHAGHSYHAKSKEEIKNIYKESVAKLNILKKRYHDSKFEISYGDTPSCTLIDDFSAVDEIRPGNFVFYDLMQYQLGVASFDDIAVALACPVVAKHKNRNEIIIYGGAIHFSKEFLLRNDNEKFYGYLVNIDFKNKNWKIINKENYLISISQEHGVLKVEDNVFDNINIGDIIGVLPVHSCLTMNLMSDFLTFDDF